MPRRPIPASAAHIALGLAAAALLCAGVLAGCAPQPVAPPSPSTPETSTAVPEPPRLIPDGTADDNLPLFTEVVLQVAATGGVEGRAYVDALVGAGFDKAAMQVTRDRTTVDHPADSIQFSVLWQGECLVGQVGPSIPQPTAVVLPALPDGGCLIGKTRPIDW